MLIGVAVALVGAGGLIVAEVADTVRDRVARQQLDNRAALVSEAAAGQLNRYVDALTLTAAGLAAVQPLTVAAFTQATASLRDLGLSGVPSVSFVVPARDDQIATTRARWQARGSRGLTLVPNPDVDEHLFSVMSQTIDGSDPPETGGDSTRAPAAAAAMRQARESGRVTVSDPYRLLPDRALPAHRRPLSFVLVAPVQGGADRAFEGWVVISLRGRDFITAALRESAQNLVDVTLLVRTAGRDPVPVAGLHTTDPTRPDLHRTLALPVAQAQWTLQIDAVAARLPGVRSAVPVTTGIVGGLIAVLAAVLITGRARADQRVRIATSELVRGAAHLHTELDARYAAEAQLRTALEDLDAQRTRLAQILDALDVVVSTCDRDGTIIHLNRAARDRLGAGSTISTLADLDALLRLHALDGHALSESELPLRRSLGGEIIDGLEVVTAGPDGSRRILQVSSRPLHENGNVAGAVASSHDITALREHQAELTAFAGVVAHDLKAPLTAVAGFAHLAVSALAAGAPRDTPRAHLHQVIEAARRMDRLIEELLRYAAARDARLDLTDVDLRAVADQAVGDWLTEQAAQPDLPVPRVFVGPLPTIRADPTMIRQLLDNLIGNSLKYARPGQPASLDITAETSPAGDLCLTVADRGIGIPPGQHGAIFAGFYRADHRGTYAGTGLGLSICQRIVQRHGGVIAAVDNPGGGTRVTVTLPAAVRPERLGA